MNDRIVTAKFDSRHNRITIFQVYDPTNDALEDAKDFFCEQVQEVIDTIPNHDIVILMGDWNTNLGKQKGGEEGVVDHYGLHVERSENGEHFVDHEVWTSSNMVFTSTMFPH